MTFHPGSPAFGLPPQRQIRDAPTPDPEMEALLYAAGKAGGHERDPDWTCPGCGLPYDDLPFGHCWTYGRRDGDGSCSDPSPVTPEDFGRPTQGNTRKPA
jgi:hypothetical protein